VNDRNVGSCGSASERQVNDRLELTADEMRRLGYQVVDILANHFAHIREKRSGTKGSPAELRAALSQPLPENPKPFDEIVSVLQDKVFANILNLIHPRFFAFVPGPSNFVSVLADTLASGFNVFNGSWLGGSAAAALELTVIDWLRQLCDFPAQAGGLFVSGGSMANLTALVAARHAKLADRTAGACVYYSDQTHFSVDRALRVIGFLPQQIRRLPADGQFRLALTDLARRVEQDRTAGLRPFCVIANAGTTSTGAVDPLRGLAEYCHQQGLWLHVDGAYGAAAVFCERGRALLDGIDMADSLSLDPHKWLFQSLECGCALVRDAAVLKSAFRTTADYLTEVHRDSSEFNPCDHGVQLTRSFRALKMWMSLQYFGAASFRRAVERGFELAEFAERRLRALPEWEVVTPAEMAIVTFRRCGADEAYYHRLHEAILADAFALISSTTLNGRTALRLCCINPRTTEADVEQTLDWLTNLLPFDGAHAE
jgi:glutamate/tyrosine decarboxylase-like PLP-dependent enzyme